MSAAAAGTAGRPLRVALVVGGAMFLVAFLIGAAASLRTDHRLPSPDLLVDGTAAYVRQLLVAKDYGSAVRQLRAYEQLSNDRLPHEQLSDALLGLGPEARAGFAAALRDGGPPYARGHYALGLAFENADEHAEAVVELEEAVRLGVGLPEAHNALGVALIHAERVDEAAAQFREAAARGYAPALENLQRLATMLDAADKEDP